VKRATFSISNRRWYCLTRAFFAREDLHQRRLVEIVEVAITGSRR